MNKLNKVLLAGASAVATLPAFAGTEISSMATAIDTSDIITGVVTVGGSVMAIYVVMKGIALVRAALQGGK